MSHHLDSPTSRKDPRLNVTDTYVFDGTRGTVLAMLTNTSLAGDDAGTNGFHPEARYEFKVHTGLGSDEDRTYRFTFGERDADGGQAVALQELTGDDARRDAAGGSRVAAGATGRMLLGGPAERIRAWAGWAWDPFYLDLNQHSSMVTSLQSKIPLISNGGLPQEARNSFEGSKVLAIVLEVDDSDPLMPPGADIGVWSVIKLADQAVGWRQVNRAGIPMMWPLFRAMGSDDQSSRYIADTGAHPAQDRANDGDRVLELVAATVGSSGSPNAHAYAEQVMTRLLPDVLPYRVGTPAVFGFAGFNGRALADNAPSVMYSLVTNTGIATGLTAASAEGTRSPDFPYVVPLT